MADLESHHKAPPPKLFLFPGKSLDNLYKNPTGAVIIYKKNQGISVLTSSQDCHTMGLNFQIKKGHYSLVLERLGVLVDKTWVVHEGFWASRNPVKRRETLPPEKIVAQNQAVNLL